MGTGIMLLIQEQATTGPLSSSRQGVLRTDPTGHSFPEASWIGVCPCSSAEKN